MNRHAKAPSAGSNEGQRKRRGSFLAVLALAICAFAASAAPASADPTTASVDSITSASYTSAHVTFTIHAEGQTYWRLDYSADEGATWVENVVNSEGPIPVSGEETFAADITGLKGGTKYLVRVGYYNESTEEGGVSPEPSPDFTTLAVSPPSASIDPVTAVTASGAHFSGHVDPQAPVGNPPGFDVNWEFKCEPECPGLSGGTVLASEGEQAISADATGLDPNTDYEVELIATNTGGTSAAAGPKTFHTDPVPLIAETIPAFALGNGTEALIGGKADVKNLASKYWVEYGPGPGGPGATYSASVPPSKDAVVPLQINGSGDLQKESGTISNATTTNGAFLVGQRISGPGIPAQTKITDVGVGANAGTITISKAASASAKGASLIATPAMTQALTQRISGLSPATTYHFRIVVENSSGKVEGEDVSFETASPLSFPASCSNLKLRTETNSALLPECRAYEMTSDPQKNGGDASSAPSSSPDGNRVGYISPSAFADAPSSNNVSSYMAQRTASGWKTRSMTPPVAIENFALSGINTVEDFNTDVTKAVSITFTGAVETGNFNMSQNIFLTSDDGSTQWATKSTLGSGRIANKLYGGRSADGSHIVFESLQVFNHESDGISSEVWEWFNGRVRLVSILPLPDGFDGPPVSGRAVVGSGTYSGETLGSGFTGTLTEPTAVSEDGSRIFFGDTVYGVFVREDGQRTEEVSLSQRSGSVGKQANSVVTFAGANADGSRVYYRTLDQMTDDAPPGGGLYVYNLETKKLKFVAAGGAPSTSIVSIDGDRTYFTAPGQLVPGKGVAGARNLYLEDGEDVTFIATLGADGVAGGVDGATPQATRDGQFLTFTSAQRLTAFDNAGHTEIYFYDAAKDSLRCVSCNPDGHTPTGDASLAAEGTLPPNFKTHGISEDGSHVFFQTTDALLPADVNGLKDVYEYRDGNVALLSTGTSNYPSIFWTASPDGKNVFFGTRDALVGQDIDGGATDIYDARVEGGFSAPAPPNPCEGENCQGKAASPPAFQSPATALGKGKGNANGRKHSSCKRKSKKQKARCGPKQKKHQAKKSSKSGRGK